MSGESRRDGAPPTAPQDGFGAAHAEDARWRRERPLLYRGAVALSVLLFVALAFYLIFSGYIAALLHPDYDAHWGWLPWLRWPLVPALAIAGAWLALRWEAKRDLANLLKVGALGLAMGAIAGYIAAHLLFRPLLEGGITLLNQGLQTRDERPSMPCTVTRHFVRTTGLRSRRPPRVTCLDHEGRSWTVPVSDPSRYRVGTHCRLQLHRGRLGLPYFGMPALARCLPPR